MIKWRSASSAGWFTVIIVLGLSLLGCSDEGRVRETVFDNGFKIVMKRDAQQDIVNVLLRVKAGSIHETGETQGISRLVEQTLFRSSPSYPDIQGTIESFGGSTSSSTTRDYVSFSFEVMGEYLLPVLDIIVDVMLHTQITDSLLAPVKQGLLASFEGEASWYQTVMELFLKNAFMVHPYRFLPSGKRESILHLHAGEANAYFHDLYIPGNMTMAIVGNIKPEEVRDRLEKSLGSFRREPGREYSWPQEPEQTEPREVRQPYKTEKPFALVCVGWRAPSVRNPDTYSMDVILASIGLGESARLRTQIQDRMNSVYHIEVEYYTPMEPGYLVIIALCDPSAAEEVKNSILSEIDIIRKDSITPQELVRAKRHFEAEKAYSRLGTKQAATYYCFWSIMKDLKFAEEYLPNIERVTLMDVQQTVERYLKMTNYTSVILIPETASRSIP